LLRAEDWGCPPGAQFASLEYLAVNDRASVFYQRRWHPSSRISASLEVATST
jgi:hypothetical protein